MSKPQRIALWVLQILLAFMFLQVGFGKLWDGDAWAGQFRQWGYPERFYLAVGFVELLGGLAILVPRTAGYGSMVLMTVMGRATVHHLLRHETTERFSARRLVISGITSSTHWPWEPGYDWRKL